MIYVVIATTKDRRTRLQVCVDAIRESTIPHSIVLYENLDGGCVLATKKAITGIHGEIFLLNDDMIVKPTCLELLKNAFDKNYPNKDGVCQPLFGDSVPGSAGAPYCHTDVIRPFLEDYIHRGWDTEFGKVMKMKGKYTIVHEASLDHRHVHKNNPDVKNDDTYRMREASKIHDVELYAERLKNGFKHRFI
jgi:hypothetical protein